MSKPSKDEGFDLSDSTDWLKTPLPLISSVDSALRCQVCKDFYTTPMITSCSHTFCSLCIRRCLNNDGKCPACRTPDQELKLRFNGAMEELVEAFKKARPGIWEFVNKPVEISAKRDRDGDDVEESPRKRTRSSGRTKPKERVLVVDSADDDDDYVEDLEDGFVNCPICQKPVREDKINAHLDRNCEDEARFSKPANRPTASKPLSVDKSISRPERLPQLNYAMVKDNPLRKKLSDQGISAGGSRQQMEKRYTEWVTLWNANCDATRPKGKGELRRELDLWERTQGSRAGSSKDSGAQIREKDFDGLAWQTKHEDSFRDLIANARKKVAPRPSTPKAPEREMVDLTTPVQATDTRPELLESNQDTEMASVEEAPIQQNDIVESSVRPSSKRRFIGETSKEFDSLDIPPSSQYSIMEKDSSIGSDLNTVRPVQP